MIIIFEVCRLDCTTYLNLVGFSLVIMEAAPVEDDHITEQTNGVAEESNGEVHIPFENGNIVDVNQEQEEEPVAEVLNAVPDNSPLVVETNVKIEEAPKKSYASIVSRQNLG